MHKATPIPLMCCSFHGLVVVAFLASNPATSATTEKVDPIFAGCGAHLDLAESRQYGQLNQEMHEGMAINFTGNAEYDFMAAMIPHHKGAGKMCEVYANSTEHMSGGGHAGIESLCYNITYGPKKWGKWQWDFSQLGEVEQMEDVLRDIDLYDHYEKGCENLSAYDKCLIAEESSHGMYMGCGRLDLQMTKDYIKANMEMHTLMALNWTGNADVDFLLGMIPHHEAAIEMCDIYYEYWSCAPRKNVCQNPLPLDEIQGMLSAGEEVDILNQMHHMCTAHIFETQPAEVKWMKQELGRISPEALAAYESRSVGYPCNSHAHGSMHGEHGSMHGEHGNMNADSKNAHSSSTMSHDMQAHDKQGVGPMKASKGSDMAHGHHKHGGESDPCASLADMKHDDMSDSMDMPKSSMDMPNDTGTLLSNTSSSGYTSFQCTQVTLSGILVGLVATAFSV